MPSPQSLSLFRFGMSIPTTCKRHSPACPGGSPSTASAAPQPAASSAPSARRIPAQPPQQPGLAAVRHSPHKKTPPVTTARFTPQQEANAFSPLTSTQTSDALTPKFVLIPFWDEHSHNLQETQPSLSRWISVHGFHCTATGRKQCAFSRGHCLQAATQKPQKLKPRYSRPPQSPDAIFSVCRDIRAVRSIFSQLNGRPSTARFSVRNSTTENSCR